MPALCTRLVRMLKIGAVAGVVVGIVRALRRGGPPEPTGTARWPPLADRPPTEPRRGPVRFADPTPPATDESTAWVEPVDGACPATHPIKGNAGSGIFHVPGGMSYDRTVAERCYATESDAEADGFRRAKR